MNIINPLSPFSPLNAQWNVQSSNATANATRELASAIGEGIERGMHDVFVVLSILALAIVVAILAGFSLHLKDRRRSRGHQPE
jgi:hypothetical protein